MWQKQIKQLKKQVILPKAEASKLTKDVETTPTEINFKDYCASQQVQKLESDQIILRTKTKTNKLIVPENLISKHSNDAFTMFDEQNSKPEYFRFGQRNLPKELRSGRYKINAVLDLHNYTKAHALNILERFIENSQPSSCIKIIHGVGLNSEHNIPVLLGVVRKYLEQHSKILAYTYGNPQQGGTGITLIKISSN